MRIGGPPGIYIEHVPYLPVPYMNSFLCHERMSENVEFIDIMNDVLPLAGIPKNPIFLLHFVIVFSILNI